MTVKSVTNFLLSRKWKIRYVSNNLVILENVVGVNPTTVCIRRTYVQWSMPCCLDEKEMKCISFLGNNGEAFINDIKGSLAYSKEARVDEN